MSFEKARKALEEIRQGLPQPPQTEMQEFQWNLSLAVQELSNAIQAELARLSRNLEMIYTELQRRK